MRKFEINAAKKVLKQRMSERPDKVGNNCLIDRIGKIIKCPFAGHRLVLLTLGYEELSAEKIGFIKVTDDMFGGGFNIYVTKQPTQAQINTVYKLLGNNPENYHWKKFAEEWLK